MKANSGYEGVGPKRASGMLGVAVAEEVGDQLRACRLTVRDCARLQGFPDGMEFCGEAEAQFRQIGNAVPPLLGGAVARAVWTALYGGAP
jgi:site-specific DNA-cytosine methylase